MISAFKADEKSESFNSTFYLFIYQGPEQHYKAREQAIELFPLCGPFNKYILGIRSIRSMFCISHQDGGETFHCITNKHEIT